MTDRLGRGHEVFLAGEEKVVSAINVKDSVARFARFFTETEPSQCTGLVGLIPVIDEL